MVLQESKAKRLNEGFLKKGGESLHPEELIELMITCGIFLIILFISFVKKGNWRKIFQVLAVIYLLSFSVFYVVRPYWIDLQIENKVGYLQMHLVQQYPKETWGFWTVPHLENGYESMNPYIIGVIFTSEPEVEYKYFVRNKDEVVQTGYSSKNELQRDFKHIEDR
jgi:hypothetical protein